MEDEKKKVALKGLREASTPSFGGDKVRRTLMAALCPS